MEHQRKRAFKTELFEQFARIGKALGSAPRLELIELLAQGEKTVEEMADALAVPLANASQHLQVLRRAQLVEADRRGTYVFYRLSDPGVFRLWQAMRDLGEARLAEIDRVVRTYLSDRHALDAIDSDELIARMREGTVTVLDVRPEPEYDAGHIAGARSLPIEELEARLGEIPDGSTVVAYCRGPYCVYSDEAVKLLIARGFDAKRLSVGLPDWVEMGLPVESRAPN